MTSRYSIESFGFLSGLNNSSYVYTLNFFLSPRPHHSSLYQSFSHCGLLFFLFDFAVGCRGRGRGVLSFPFNTANLLRGTWSSVSSVSSSSSSSSSSSPSMFSSSYLSFFSFSCLSERSGECGRFDVARVVRAFASACFFSFANFFFSAISRFSSLEHFTHSTSPGYFLLLCQLSFFSGSASKAKQLAL